MKLTFVDQLETPDGGGLEGEAPDLGRAKAGGSDEMELVVRVEQPQRDRVDGEGGDEGIRDVLERRHEALIGKGGDCLLEHAPSPFPLLEEIPRPHLVGQVDRERDDNAAPTMGVDPLEACAPPPRAAPGEVVQKLRQMTSLSGCSHFLERRGKRRGTKLLVERHVRVAVVEQRGVGVHELERLGVVDDQA
jgi:hypothetical protein